MFQSLARVWALVVKELLAVLKDPRGRATIFVPPALQCLVFGYVATFDLTRVPYAVDDRDRSVASARLIHDLDGSGVFLRVAETARPDGAATLIDDRRALLVIGIDQDFQRRLEHGQAAAIQALADGRNSNTAATALGYLNTIVGRFNADWRAAHGVAGPPAVRLTTRAWYNENLETRWNIVPSLVGALTIGEMLLVTAMAVAREREQGTIDQLLVTPFRPSEIMAGKAIPAVLVGFGQSTVILLVAQFWFRIPFAGSYLDLYAGIGLFLFAATGAGLLVSAFARSMQQALLFSFLLIMPFTLLSGLLTPLSNMPRVLQALTLINPLRYMIDLAQRTYLEGQGLAQLTPDLAPMGLIALVTLTCAAVIFKGRLA